MGWARSRFLIVLGGALLSATAARASLTSININSTGGGFTSGALETDWTLTSPTAVLTTPFVTEGSPTGFPFTAWGPDNLPTYGWISAQQSYTTSSADAAGVWIFSTTFSLAGDNPTTADISFKIAVDNSVANNSVTLNGHVLTITGLSAAGFNLSTATFTIGPGDFVAGTNTLSFAVTNGNGNAGNPVGLLVDFTSATVDTATPEPGTALLLAGGFLWMIAWRRRNYCSR
jgi:hypothetical protein